MNENRTSTGESRITRRGFLILKAMAETGLPYSVASDAVRQVEVEHPAWDLDEKRTWSEWERAEA